MPLLNYGPLHDAMRKMLPPDKRAAADQTPPVLNPDSGLIIKTLRELNEESQSVGFLDTPYVKWGAGVNSERTNPSVSPYTKKGSALVFSGAKPRVAVIGGGISGLMTAWQLLKLGITVNLYEQGADPATSLKAGRLHTEKIGVAPNQVLVEMGAMRYPRTSVLFWHYVRTLVNPTGDLKFTQFPNPGTVASLFRSALQVTGISSNPSGANYDFSGTEKLVIDKVIKGIGNYVPPGILEPLINVSYITSVLGKARSPEEEVLIAKFWRAMVKDLNSLSFRGFLLIKIGLTNDEVAIFGNVGFGTGGMEAMFNVGSLDILRLGFWDYSKEFAYPEQYNLPIQLRNKIREALPRVPGSTLEYNINARSVAFFPSEKKYYILNYNQNDPINVRKSGPFDYVILAMTHIAAKELLSNNESWGESYNYLFGGVPRSARVYPLYDTLKADFISEIRSDLENLGSFNSVKIFHTMSGTESTTVPGTPGSDWTKLQGQRRQ